MNRILHAGRPRDQVISVDQLRRLLQAEEAEPEVRRRMRLNGTRPGAFETNWRLEGDLRNGHVSQVPTVDDDEIISVRLLYLYIHRTRRFLRPDSSHAPIPSYGIFTIPQLDMRGEFQRDRSI